MDNILTKAIQSAQNATIAFSKFITSNDVGATGSHQSGFHIHKSSWKLFFDKPGIKGSNADCYITIKWQDDFETDSRFIYYGTGTRNEYRLTRFGKNFPFLTDDNVGDLLIICKTESNGYLAFVLQSDDDIENFFAALNISSDDTNGLIPKQFQSAESILMNCFKTYIASLSTEFPITFEISSNARNCFNKSFGIKLEIIRQNPDLRLLNWLNSEFQLFKVIENYRYADRIKMPFESVEELIILSNTILNRRKSRAGKSLEHHLAEIFNIFNIKYASQLVTEDYKKPDFIFPNAEAYYNKNFDTNNLLILA